MDWHQMIPRDKTFSPAELQSAHEIRLRSGYPVQVMGRDGMKSGNTPLTPEDLLLAAQALTGHQLARYAREITEGFLPLPGGHRMGICGERGEQGILRISSLCIRIAHEIKEAAAAVFPIVRQQSLLILGPPGSGKTTLLRDIVRRTAMEIPVALCDTRGEIAACFQGVPQLDIGPLCDVMTGGQKGQVMEMMLRSMNPKMIATDELGSPADALALLEMQRCGVGIIATAHASSWEEAKKRAVLQPLFESRVFSHAVLLEYPGKPPRLLSL